MGTPNREPHKYSRNIVEYRGPARYIPMIFLRNSWGSLFKVPSKVPLQIARKHSFFAVFEKSPGKAGSVEVSSNFCTRCGDFRKMQPEYFLTPLLEGHGDFVSGLRMD